MVDIAHVMKDMLHSTTIIQNGGQATDNSREILLSTEREGGVVRGVRGRGGGKMREKETETLFNTTHHQEFLN